MYGPDLWDFHVALCRNACHPAGPCPNPGRTLGTSEADCLNTEHLGALPTLPAQEGKAAGLCECLKCFVVCVPDCLALSPTFARKEKLQKVSGKLGCPCVPTSRPGTPPIPRGEGTRKQCSLQDGGATCFFQIIPEVGKEEGLGSRSEGRAPCPHPVCSRVSSCGVSSVSLEVNGCGSRRAGQIGTAPWKPILLPQGCQTVCA